MRLKLPLYSFIIIFLIGLGVLYYYTRLGNALFLDCAAIPSMAITIEDKEWNKIIATREKALALGRLKESKYVNGSLAWAEESSAVKLRLKGDWLDHIEGDRWSFRIKTGKDALFQGMRRFSIQDPFTRKGLFEWLFHRMLKNEQLFYLNYDFAEVVLNGEPKGLYAVEEHFGNELIAKMGRPPGVILKFNEDAYWDIVHLTKEDLSLDKKTYLKAPIEAYQAKQVKKDAALKAQRDRGAYLLEQFRLGTKKGSEVFDLDQTARFMAVCAVFNARHALRWHNRRWYYNSDSDRLEPIGFDADARKLKNPLIDDTFINSAQRSAFILDTVMMRTYIKELERVSQPAFLDAFFDAIGDEYACVTDQFVLSGSEFDISRYTTTLANNQAKIREYLPEVRKRYRMDETH